MQASELVNVIENFNSIKKNFVGIYSFDTIPKRFRSNGFLISNTQNSSEPGEHWFCLIKKSPKKFEYFDSLGVDEAKLKKIQTLKVFNRHSTVVFNETPFQKQTSISCGLFVLYFIIHRMHNLDMSFSELLEEIFVIDCNKNELIVEKFAHDMF